MLGASNDRVKSSELDEVNYSTEVLQAGICFSHVFVLKCVCCFVYSVVLFARQKTMAEIPFAQYEKQVLLDLANRQKQEAWEKLTLKYNGTPGVIKRTSKQLTSHYKKLKWTAQNHVNDQRETYKTGGGPSKNSITPTDERLLAAGSMKLGHRNNFDSQAEYEDQVSSGEDVVEEFQAVEFEFSQSPTTKAMEEPVEEHEEVSQPTITIAQESSQRPSLVFLRSGQTY